MNNAKDFVIKDGILKKYVGNDENVIVPVGIIGIAEKAFYRNDMLETVILPEGLEYIGNRAFEHCTALKSINLPESLKKAGSSAFHTCVQLEELIFPQEVTFPKYKNPIAQCWFMHTLIMPSTLENRNIDFPGCNSLDCLVCPNLKIENISAKYRGAAIRGYIKFTEKYKEDVTASYNAYLLKRGKRLLETVFDFDSVKSLSVFAKNGKITVRNFEEDFLNPAIESNAKQCIAFLMDWRDKNITAEDIEKQMARELTKDPYNVTDMKRLWSYKNW